MAARATFTVWGLALRLPRARRSTPPTPPGVRTHPIRRRRCLARELLTTTRMHRSSRVRFDPWALDAGVKPLTVAPLSRASSLMVISGMVTTALGALPALDAALGRVGEDGDNTAGRIGSSLLLLGREVHLALRPGKWTTADGDGAWQALVAYLSATARRLLANLALSPEQEKATAGLGLSGLPTEGARATLALMAITAVLLFPALDVESAASLRRKRRHSRGQQTLLRASRLTAEHSLRLERARRQCRHALSQLVRGVVDAVLYLSRAAVCLVTAAEAPWAAFPVACLTLGPLLAASAHWREVRLINATMSDTADLRPPVGEVVLELGRIRGARSAHMASFVLSLAVGAAAGTLSPRPSVPQLTALGVAWLGTGLIAVVTNQSLRLWMRAQEVDDEMGYHTL